MLPELKWSYALPLANNIAPAAKASKGVYMMAENYTYMKPNQIVKELVRQGLFGTPYYAEGEYLHELKELNEKTLWRRRWQTGVNGITYGTHSLGPILQWMPGDRVTRVCCEGSDDDVGGTRHGGHERNPADQAGFSITHDPPADLFPVPFRIRL